MASRFTQYGGAAGADMALREMVAQRIAAQMEAEKVAQERYKLQQDDRRIGQGDRRLDIDVDQFGQTHALNTRKVDEDVRQFDAQAPNREAHAGYLRTQMKDLEQKPLYQTAERAHEENLARLGHGFRLGQINRQGEIDAGLLQQRQQNAPSGSPMAQEAADTAREVVRIASALRKHPGKSGAFGLYQSKLPTMRQSTADAEVLRDTLSSLLTLENMGKMKGVLSDADLKILRQASTTLSSTASDEAASAELDRLVEVMTRAANSGVNSGVTADDSGLGGGADLEALRKQYGY